MLRISVRAVAVVVALVALHFVCVVPYRGNLALREISRRSEVAQSTDEQTAAILARQNLEELDRAASGRRLDPAWYMLYAANCAVVDRMPAAVDAYTRALRIDDRPELYVSRALALLRLGRTDDAIADLAKAARFNPSVIDNLDGELRARVKRAAGLR